MFLPDCRVVGPRRPLGGVDLTTRKGGRPAGGVHFDEVENGRRDIVPGAKFGRRGRTQGL